jgi:anti-sigma regulatory factor (Ser/Thr protein kinase)
MTPSAPVLLTIAESSQVAEARRIATDMARGLDFTDEQAGAVAIAVTEAAANLVKHAREGRLQLRQIDSGESAIELLAIDRGPGMNDPVQCVSDGFSTSGTPGTGLGAIRRLAAEFDLYSQPGLGTVLLGRVFGRRREKAFRLSNGVVQAPARGENVCGDAWIVTHTSMGATVMVADGLGHGPLAAEAANCAARIVRSAGDQDPAAVLQQVHLALRPTRGAAVAIAQIDLGRSTVRYAGVGNISGLMIEPRGIQRLVSHNGTAGAQVRRIQQFEYAWPRNGLLVMFSDGLASTWDFAAYPALRNHDPAVIAGVLYRDHNRGRDDATVIVVRPNEA